MNPRRDTGALNAARTPAHVPVESCPKCLLKAAMATSPCAPPAESALATTSAPRANRGLPEPGAQLGHYTIVRLLGSGAWVQSLKRRIMKAAGALPSGAQQSLDAPEARQRFLREGRLAASLNHPIAFTFLA